MRTEEQEESYELHVVRDHTAKGNPGHFVLYLFLAFQFADADNFEDMRPAIQKAIVRYDLACTCQPDDLDAWKGPLPDWRTKGGQ